MKLIPDILKEFQTCDLVEELVKREGVEMHKARMRQTMKITITGPFIVITIDQRR